MITLRLFAQAREAAGEKLAMLPGGTVGEVLDAAVERFGPELDVVLAGSRVWLNGSPANTADVVNDGDEVAVLPPVSGG